MTTLRVEIVPIVLEKHPNADQLSICKVFDYPVIVRTEDWSDQLTGAYIPIDAVVPDTPEFAFLDGHRRIRAKKLRGIFSQGLLVPVPDGAQLGDDVAERLGITKYEPPEPLLAGGEVAPPPPVYVPTYTDIEHLRRYAHVFSVGEPIVVTEKIHGANGRWLVHEGVLHAGSHHQWKKEDSASLWWKVATPEFRTFLAALPPGSVVFGEVYGSVQDLRYGFGPGRIAVRLFDVYQAQAGQFLDWPAFLEVVALAQNFGVEAAPVLWSGPFDLERIVATAEQDSALGGPGHVMEGVVVRPLAERFNLETGRVILKLHSARYLLRKDG